MHLMQSSWMGCYSDMKKYIKILEGYRKNARTFTFLVIREAILEENERMDEKLMLTNTDQQAYIRNV